MGIGARIGIAAEAVAVAGAVTAGALYATSDRGGSKSESAEQTASDSGTASKGSSANPLWGTWTAPCERILNAMVGEDFEEQTCAGTYRLEFAPDGTFTQRASGTITTRSPDGDFEQTLPWSANKSSTWTTNDNDMRIGGSSSAPVSITPDEEGSDGVGVASLTNTGMFPFEVTNSTLTMHPSFPAIGRVTLVYDRG